MIALMWYDLVWLLPSELDASHSASNMQQHCYGEMWHVFEDSLSVGNSNPQHTHSHTHKMSLMYNNVWYSLINPGPLDKDWYRFKPFLMFNTVYTRYIVKCNKDYFVRCYIIRIYKIYCTVLLVSKENNRTFPLLLHCNYNHIS